jgi:hypothetical protein
MESVSVIGGTSVRRQPAGVERCGFGRVLLVHINKQRHQEQSTAYDGGEPQYSLAHLFPLKAAPFHTMRVAPPRPLMKSQADIESMCEMNYNAPSPQTVCEPITC